MEDNSKNRLHNVFFYGLYMDPEIFESKGVKIRNARKAYADHHELRIGNKATLLRAENKQAHGMVYSLTHAEINSLYWGAGLDDYVAEAVLVKTEHEILAALCCNLLVPPESAESNADYSQKLKKVMEKLQLPMSFS